MAISLRMAGSAETVEAKSKPKVDGRFEIFVPRLFDPAAVVDKLLADFCKAVKDVRRQYKIRNFLYDEEQVRKSLRDDEGMMEGARRLFLEERDPSIPPLTDKTREQLVHVIDGNLLEKQIKTFTYRLEDDGLYLPHQKKPPVTIVESTDDVAQDPKILATRFNNNKVTEWLKLLSEREMSPTDVQIWLHLCLVKLARGERLAPNTNDVLNAGKFQDQQQDPSKSPLLAAGNWFSDQVWLDEIIPSDSYGSLRVRASVGGDVPKT